MELYCRGRGRAAERCLGQAICYFFHWGVAKREPTWSERIRDLIDEIDRVRSESERVRGHADRAMKEERFWPDRRREPRFPPSDKTRREHHR